MIFQCYSLVLGDPSVLVRLVHDGQLNLDKMEDHTEEELRTILGRCGASITPASTKVSLSLSLSFFLSLSLSFCQLFSMCSFLVKTHVAVKCSCTLYCPEIKSIVFSQLPIRSL